MQSYRNIVLFCAYVPMCRVFLGAKFLRLYPLPMYLSLIVFPFFLSIRSPLALLWFVDGYQTSVWWLLQIKHGTFIYFCLSFRGASVQAVFVIVSQGFAMKVLHSEPPCSSWLTHWLKFGHFFSLDFEVYWSHKVAKPVPNSYIFKVYILHHLQWSWQSFSSSIFEWWKS